MTVPPILRLAEAFLLVVLVAAAGCGDDVAFGVPAAIDAAAGPDAVAQDAGGPASPSGTTSVLCEGLEGGEAILWDLYNGVVRVDPVLPPPIPSPNQAFGHPQVPSLGFFYPTGWSAETLGAGIHDFGVNILRDDARAIWRQHSMTANGVPAPRDVRDAELATLRQFMGLLEQPVELVCVNEGAAEFDGGVTIAGSNALFRVGDQSGVIVASVTTLPGLGTSSVMRQVVSAPTVEFGARAIDTFLAIDMQMSRGTDANLFDRDGDGWRDGVDAFPDDPSRH